MSTVNSDIILLSRTDFAYYLRKCAILDAPTEFVIKLKQFIIYYLANFLCSMVYAFILVNAIDIILENELFYEKMSLMLQPALPDETWWNAALSPELLESLHMESD